MKSLVVYSGGMDSTTVLYKMVKDLGRENVSTISFNYGSKHNDMEYSYAKKICDRLEVSSKRIDLPFINDLFTSDLLKSGGDIPEGHYESPVMKRTVVPFRNGIMLAIATGYAESISAGSLVLGNHYGDHAIYPDCRREFIAPMTKAIKAGTYSRVELWSPFCEITKTDIVKIGEELNVPWELTYSCYKGNEKHCGKCGTCVERIEAFADAEVKELTKYEVQ